MKIVQINAVYGVGSTGNIVKDIHEMLIEHGHDSYVFWGILCKNANNDELFYQIGSVLDHKIHAFLRRIGKNQGWHSKLATILACNKLKSLKPDIVHLHNLHSNYMHLPTLLKFLGRNNINVLLTVHDCWFYTGYCNHYYKYNNCQNWKNGCNNCPAVPSLYSSYIRHLFSTKTKLFSEINNLHCNGVSQWTMSDITNSIAINPKSCSFIYNWIDTKIFKPYDKRDEILHNYGVSSTKKIILGVAQGWSKDKGLEEFELISEALGDAVTIILVGNYEGPEISKNILFIGYTGSQQKLAELYSAADVFVNPSSFETFGLVTAEAMACGTPVVAYNNTGTKELITSDCGVLVENKNYIKLVDSVKEVISKPKEFFSEKCVYNVNKKFEKNKQLAKYLALYEDILKQGNL